MQTVGRGKPEFDDNILYNFFWILCQGKNEFLVSFLSYYSAKFVFSGWAKNQAANERFYVLGKNGEKKDGGIEPRSSQCWAKQDAR